MFTAAALTLAGLSAAGDSFAGVQSVGGGGGPQVWKSFGTFMEIVLERRWGWGLKTLEGFCNQGAACDLMDPGMSHWWW